MRRDVVWCLLVIMALIAGFLAGYIFGEKKAIRYALEEESTHEVQQSVQEEPVVKSAVGSYKTDSWNGESAALVIKKDGTCHYPSGGVGKWEQEGDKILIVLDHNDSVHEAEIVSGGVLLYEEFFEEVK